MTDFKKIRVFFSHKKYLYVFLLALMTTVFFTSSCQKTQEAIEKQKEKKILNIIEKQIESADPEKLSKEAEKYGKNVSAQDIKNYKKEARKFLKSLK